ncbi:MAG: DUF4129 domain-containing protein [Flavobacteriaceae bacterium]|nr:DUF4129 domain-containing protein [Flavobacteriaceae bacterium]
MNKGFFIHIALLFSMSIGPVQAFEYQESSSISADSLQKDDSVLNERRFDNLSEKYSGEEFIYERKVESSGWWTRFKQWLSDFFKDLFNFENRQEAEKATDLLIDIAAVLLFLLVAFFIVKAILNKEGQWVFGKSSEKNIIPVTDIESNIQAADFKNLIMQAEKNNNFRLAIRYYYLWLLKSLNSKAIIHYDVEKTNSDYRDEIQSEQLRSAFDYTSYLYNYIWYGEFDVTEVQFRQAKTAFNRFIDNLTA